MPDEPYAFSAAHGPEMSPGLPVALVSGRHLEWYGPSLTEARGVLSATLPRSGPASSPRP
ncbi:helical backbone metal receptor [Actinoallomurus spadix]|uniref:helical backbone metal receptor n=1 Tax=Actinoallomurus spadix TaxID=79912 RepID=UPI0038737516